MKIDPLYILPNLFTGVSVYLGVLSIGYAFVGNIELACWLVLVSLIFDGLDGRVARLTGTTSRFGMEFDSLADVVAFGVAPSMLLFMHFGHYFGKLGIMVSGMFVVLGAIRLARFNINTGKGEPNVFIGLPIPAAAVFVVSWLLVALNFADIWWISSHYFSIGLLIGAFFVSFLMVSNIRYPSFKKINWREVKFIQLIILLMFMLAVLFLYPILGIVTLITLYVLYGPCRAIYYYIYKKVSFNKN